MTSENSIIAFVRYDEAKNDFVLVVANLTASGVVADINMNSYMGKWINVASDLVTLDELQSFSLGAYDYQIFTRG